MEKFKRNLIKQTLSAPEKLKEVGQWLVEKVGSSLSEFATFVCEKCNFKNESGELQKITCVDALKKLDSQGLINLQEHLSYVRRNTETVHKPTCLDGPVPEPEDVPERVDEIASLRLEKVVTNENRKILYTLLRDEHYLGEKLPPGYRISYLVKSEHGFLGAVCFSSAANRLATRDHWIGWSDRERKENLDGILNMSRFLIRKNVHCKNLATKVISMSLETVKKDCQEQYHFFPYLVETFVDSEKYAGTCYKAAGWEEIGETKGRGWNDRYNNNFLSKKKIFVKALVPNFREQLGLKDVRLMEELKKIPEWTKKEPLMPFDCMETENWARLEFGPSQLGHKVRNARLITSAALLCKTPHFSPNVAFHGDISACNGWYNFVETKQKKVSFDSILSGPKECTNRRIMSQQVVLIVQDDTKLNYTSKPQIEGLGPIAKNQTNAKSRGLILHTSLAVTPNGLPLGIFNASYFTREDKEEGENPKKRRPEEKESYVWTQHARYCNEVGQYMPNTQLITVCDRGADIAYFIYECFDMKYCRLIVRAKNDRSIPEETESLFKILERGKPAGKIVVKVPRQTERPKLSGKAAKAGREERTATLEIRHTRVKIAPPPERKGQPPIEVYAVSAVERNPPRGEKGIVWRLLTTLPVTTFDEAFLCVKYYAKRWSIEDFHRVLKTGCKVEQMAYKNVVRLARALAVYMVVTCRLMLMLKLGREIPNLPPDILFDDIEMSVLRTLNKDEKKKPILTLYSALLVVAKLGGYLCRNSDQPPGYEVFWKGYQTLEAICDYERKKRELESQRLAC
ncbi:MAG: IS4 family transposase [Desulfovibrio sp.]|nr:IS4 family transposase [Desulfovibrio sp.]